ncbi:Glucanase inhibitor protein 1 [Phytophthora ramorum]|uniref:Peptidase S1 domain-containing protein n=1 Tax=Phytophthora ramorum TaxID=164328 RepID=H3GAF5_PHYRM|nr:Glucanase inhibitor protein 1 [Phytophthora ramorum]
MKVISTLAAASIALGVVAANADAEHAERRLILGGGEVPIGTKAYAVGVRTTADGDTFCGGALISPTHVLTTAACTGSQEIGFAAVGTFYINGTKDGEHIKVVSAQNHTDYNASSGSYDFGVLTLEKASKFPPIKLPAADDSDILPGMWTKVMGWGDTSYPNGTRSNELHSVGLEVWDNEECSRLFTVDNSSVCAGGAAGKDSCIGDTGGPLVKEKGQGDADDILIGLVSWGSGCGDQGIPAVYSRVSSAIEWLNTVTKTQ